MQIEADDKIKIVNQKVIMAATGSVGYTQRLYYHLDRCVNGGGFLTTKKKRKAAASMQEVYCRPPIKLRTVSSSARYRLWCSSGNGNRK